MIVQQFTTNHTPIFIEVKNFLNFFENVRELKNRASAHENDRKTIIRGHYKKTNTISGVCCEQRKTVLLYKSNNFFKVLFISVIRPSSETFLCEKSARNNNVSSTRNY